ncbi:MAG: hypothetical protein ACE5JG_06775, partial [Planctomycetota bacterium]
LLGPRPERLVGFYRTARPPGLWGPVAALAPDVPRRRLEGWRAGLGGLLLVFGTTLGLGAWLFGEGAGVVLGWSLAAVLGALVVWRRRRA